jgi:hypothetical protein
MTKMIRSPLSALLCFTLLACVPESNVQSARSTRSAAEPAPDNRSNFAQRLLAAHNAARAEKGRAPLAWSPTLAAAAVPWARTVAGDGRLRHSDKAGRPGQGENIWMGTAAFYSLEHMMARFVDEKRDFRPGVFPDISDTGKWQDVAHYTQIVWPETREVGCALETARGRDALVCRYSPPGNVNGQRID